MAATITRTKIKNDAFAVTIEETLTGNGSTTAQLFSSSIQIQITGSATSITGKLERSTRDPSLGSPNWATVAALSGNPSTGIITALYTETGVSWWRVTLTAITGADVTFALTGRAV
jgi:hypothetical protein